MKGTWLFIDLYRVETWGEGRTGGSKLLKKIMYVGDLKASEEILYLSIRGVKSGLFFYIILDV